MDQIDFAENKIHYFNLIFMNNVAQMFVEEYFFNLVMHIFPLLYSHKKCSHLKIKNDLS